MDADMRRIEIEEVEDAKTKANNFVGIIRLEALDSRTGTCGAYANPNTNLNGSLSEEDRQVCAGSIPESQLKSKLVIP
ncbi:hypothetical protein JHK84_045188 [Glycine max]|nr:hypothetical protein JHK84_045188 [Glycine max]